MQVSTQPYSICKEYGCNNLTKDTYCKDHEHIEYEKELKRHKDYNKRRDPVLVQFYNSKEWRRLREYVMSKYHYLCCQCGLRTADVVDHVIPVLVKWSLRLDIKNCQPLCHECHNIKTAEDKMKYNL